MDFFPITNFRPVETKSDPTDTDRSVLRRAEGVAVSALGSIGPGPCWLPLWGITDLAAQAATLLSAADPTKTHFLRVARGAHVVLVSWSIARGEPTGVFHVEGSAGDFAFDSTSGLSITAPSGSAYRDKDGQAPWYLSVLSSRVVLGNGIDANLTWEGGALVPYAPAAPTTIYQPAREAFPPCTAFCIGPGRNVFATGNAAAPLRVWLGRAASDTFTEIVGVYDDETSKVDVLYSGGTKTTGLSVWQNYVTVHTDHKPVNFYTVDEDVSTGIRVRQAPSPANSSAPCPACAGDHLGAGPFYFGADGEVYTDQATRTGPYNKTVARDQDIATAEGANDWNAAMVKPIDSRYSGLVYDRETRLLWLFSRTSVPADRGALWAYNDRADGVSGPFRYPNAAAIGVFRTLKGRTVAIVATSSELLYANLSAVVPPEAWLQDAPGTALGAAFAEAALAPTPSAGVPYVGINAAGTGFAQVVAGKRIELATPWSEWTETSALTLTRYLNNAHLGIVELGYLDFGNGDLFKQYLEARVKLQPTSRCYLGVFLESQNRVRSGRWYGSAYPREEIKVPANLLGQRVRVRLLVLFFNSQPAQLRGLSLGYVAVGDQ